MLSKPTCDLGNTELAGCADMVEAIATIETLVALRIARVCGMMVDVRDLVTVRRARRINGRLGGGEEVKSR